MKLNLDFLKRNTQKPIQWIGIFLLVLMAVFSLSIAIISCGEDFLTAEGYSQDASFQLKASNVTLSKTNDVIMTYSGLTVVSYGGYLNGESFQQDGILTYNGYQYTCFWNNERRVILARRQLPNGGWSKIEISSYTNTANDAHNTISLGICPYDGTLHVAFDHHGSDLQYIRSKAGLVTGQIPWETASFNNLTHYMGTTYITQVTYPRYITTPSGNLLFEYRYTGL